MWHRRSIDRECAITTQVPTLNVGRRWPIRQVEPTLVAHHEHSNARSRRTRASERTSPYQSSAVAQVGPHDRGTRVCPRADGEPDVSARGPQRDEVVELRGKEHVVPARQHRGGRDAAVVTREVDDVPPSVIRVIVREPLLVEVDVTTNRRPVGVSERKCGERWLQRVGRLVRCSKARAGCRAPDVRADAAT